MRHGLARPMNAAVNRSWPGERLCTPLGVGVSLALHAALLLVLLRGADAPAETPLERSIAVDLISTAQYAAATAIPLLTAPAGRSVVEQQSSAPVPPPEAPPAEAPSSAPPGMVHATQLRAASVLAEPASKDVRETLPLLDSSERAAQLCNIEALEQINAADASLDADILVAYAMADMDVAGLVVDANGGAFRSKRQWYNFKFHCEVAADFQAVADFSFLIGEPIPKGEWESHDLTAEDADLD